MLEPGTKLGRYDIKSLIGAGGMGEVYLASDPKIGREVAIKVLPSDVAGDAERLARFEQEAQAAGALNHPNILAIYDIDTHDGCTYVVSELLQGDTLRWQVGGGPLAVRRATDYAMQVAHGLAAAHEKGIIHRDLKPENLFVTKDGRVKILDFGLAKLTEPDGNGGGTEMPTRRIKTGSGTIMGTAGYMSPEQLRGQPVDARTDIFSFGAVLYEMLSGQKAFLRDSAADTISAVLREDPPDLSDTNEAVNPGLDRVVRRCLEKNREQRFHSASDLAFALEALTGIRTADSNATAIMTAPVSAVTRKRDWRTMVPWAAAALCLMAAAVFGWLYFTRAESRGEVVRFAIAPPPKVGIGEAMAISPDGRYLAFEAVGTNGLTTLWVRPIDSIESRELTGTGGAALPFWSPDSRHLAFFADGELKRIDVAGGPPQKLAPVSADTRGGSWSSNGTIIFTPGVTEELFKIAATGGVAEPVTTLDEKRGQTSHRWPDFLPDGRHFLYFGRGNNKELEGIFVGSLDGGEPKFVVGSKIRAEFVPDATGGVGRLLFVR
ncbi:MAG TPA: protein kinase, partial [Pyrinomonadaceae bacterium]|nr:protein kinase [Pyrinomonadaceae bacterium]